MKPIPKFAPIVFIPPTSVSDYSNFRKCPASHRNLKFLLLFASIILSQNIYARKEKVAKRQAVEYETDGHYWTVLLVYTMLDKPDAQTVAYYSEYPDNVMNRFGHAVKSRPTFILPWAQKKLHSLTGGVPSFERQLSIDMVQAAKTSKELGYALHRLADSFAHTNDKKNKMYPHIIGHTLLWKKPDKISTNPRKYLEYVRALVTSLGGDISTFDMRVFEYIAKTGLSSAVNASILKAEYSLTINAVAFNINSNHLSEVKRYLFQRDTVNADRYIVHSETDGKGKSHVTIIPAFKNPFAFRYQDKI